MTLQNFWNIIENAWQDSRELNIKRLAVFESNDEKLLGELSMELEGAILENYKRRLLQLDKEEFTSFIHHLEERMYHIDREDIHEYTDGSDDGFLYCRCFIVGMGQHYYDMVDNNPPGAAMDLEAELFGFSAYGIYEEKFGEAFERYSYHSMETCSNSDKWQL